MQWSSTRIEITANGVPFAALADGPNDGPLALCLHGFPDSAHTWRYLLPELAAAGFHAVAPWMRGYAPTAVPADGFTARGHSQQMRAPFTRPSAATAGRC